MLPRCVCLSLAVLAIPANASAAGNWGSAETVGRGGVFAPRAALDGQGNAVMIWGAQRGSDRVIAGARRTPRRGFGEPFVLRRQRGSLEPAEVAFAGRTAIAVYRRHVLRNHRIEYARIAASGQRSEPDLLSGAGESAYNPAFALAPGRRPLLSWNRRSRSRIQLVRMLGLQPRVATLAFPGYEFLLGSAQLPDGTFLALGRGASGGLVIAPRRDGEPFGPPEAIPGTRSYRAATIAPRPDGAAVVAWVDATGRLRAALREPSGGIATLELSTEPTSGKVRDPRLAITASGKVRVVYRFQADGTDRQPGLPLHMVTLGDGARPRAITSDRALDFRLATDARGAVTLLWRRRATWRGGVAVGPVRTTEITTDGRLLASRTLTSRGEHAAETSLAAGPRGDAIAAWTVGRGERVRAVRRRTHPARGF